MRRIWMPLPLLLLAGCFDPSAPSAPMLDGSSDDGGTTAGDDRGESSATADPTSVAGDDDSSTGVDASSDTGDAVDPGCGNGIIEPGELCYAAPVVLDTPQSGFGIAIGRLDGDAHADVVISDGGSVPASLRILRGHGDGTFDPAQIVAAPSFVWRVDVGAIADGLADIVASDGSGGVWRWRGNGDGTFLSADAVGVAQLGLALVDLDADGRLDLIGTGDPTKGLRVHRGLVGEWFDAPTDVYAQGAPVTDVAVDVGDLDGDGDPDVVSAGNDGLAAFLGQDGVLGGPVAVFGAADFTRSIVLGDFDADDHLDVAAGYHAVTTIYFGDGTGAFADPVDVTVQGQAIGLCAVDADADGRDDLVVANSSGSISVVRALAGRGFTPQQVFTLGDAAQQSDVACGDLNEDGVADAVIVAQELGAAHVMLSTP